jgi:GxxExxY protein
MEFDELSRRVIGCAIEVHRNLGPGLLESTYRQCLAYELSHAGLSFQMECRYRCATKTFYWIVAIESI